MLQAKPIARTMRRAVTRPSSAKLLDSPAVFRMIPAVGGDVTPAVGAAAVDVGDAVGVGKLAGADDRAAPAGGVGVLGKCGHPSRDVAGRLRDSETGTSRGAVAPVRLGDSEVLQHLL